MTTYTPEQRAHAAFAAGELSFIAARLLKLGLDVPARSVRETAALLMEIGEVSVTPEALAALEKWAG